MGSATPWRWVGQGEVAKYPVAMSGEHGWHGRTLLWSFSPQMHMVHVNTKYQSLGAALGHHSGLAVLAVLLVVRAPPFSWKGVHEGLWEERLTCRWAHVEGPIGLVGFRGSLEAMGLRAAMTVSQHDSPHPLAEYPA